MIYSRKTNYFIKTLSILTFSIILFLYFSSCSTFTYRTYPKNEQVEDPEPNYNLTLNPRFQEYTNFMFIGNRIENFGTYFNTFFNAEQSFDDAYDDYQKRVLSRYSERIDSILIDLKLSQDASDNFNKAIERASKVIQYHKSSAFMDRAVLLIGKSYYYLGDYLKAERKFNEFISKLSNSPLLEETYLYLAKTQIRMRNNEPALDRLNKLISSSSNSFIAAQSYQALAEYYISLKDFESAIKDFNKSIELSDDNSFKAQMQFIIATIISRSDALKAASEYNKVLDYTTTYDLEYLAKFNNVKCLILGGDFNKVIGLLDDMDIKYKDDQNYLAQLLYLRGLYYTQKKDYNRAKIEYGLLMQKYPKTISSADASFVMAKYYENIIGDYLNAYRFYRYATEENAAMHDYYYSFEKTKVFKKYFDLRSIIEGKTINTDYDSLFYLFTQTNKPEREGENPLKDEGKGTDNKGHNGKPGGLSSEQLIDTLKEKGNDQLDPLMQNKLKEDSIQNLLMYSSPDTLKEKMNIDLGNMKDSVKEKTLNTSDTSKVSTVDSAKIKKDAILSAKFELSEVFIYDLNKPDSAEKYLKEAFDESDNSDFKAKVLFSLGNLYLTENKSVKAEETLKQLIDDYPLSSLANESRRLLNIPLVDQVTHDVADSLFSDGEKKFVNNNYPEALTVFKDIVANYASSKHYLKSAYAAGWIYENVYQKADSAYDYYSKLLTSDPTSDITKLVTAKLTIYKQEKDSAKIKSDSLLKSTSNSDSLKTDSSKVIPDTTSLKSPENQQNNLDSGIEQQQKKDDTNGGIPPDIKKEDEPNLNPSPDPSK